MIKITLAMLVLCMCATVASTAQEPIPPYTEVAKSREWYEQQHALWNAAISKNPKDGNAWYNSYLALRYVRFGGGIDHQQHANRVATFLSDMDKAIAGMFEANLIHWRARQNDLSQDKYLLDCIRERPNDPRLCGETVPYFELKLNRVERDKYLRHWYSLGTFSPALLDFNYNLLASCAPNSILVTAGDNDTFPAWILQVVKNIRPDVTIINMGLLFEDDYRKQLLRKEVPGIDLSRYNELADDAQCVELIRDIGEHASRRVHVASTCDLSLFESVQDKLYLVGLTYVYSKNSFDNVTESARVWDLMRKDAIVHSWNSEHSAFYINRFPEFRLHYATPAMSIYEHALNVKDAGLARRVRADLDGILALSDNDDLKKALHEIERKSH